MRDENQSDFEIDLSSFREVCVLGSGLFSIVKLMKDFDSKQFAVKYFTRWMPGDDTMAQQVFSCKLKAFCHLRHLCIVRIYHFARKAKDYEGAFLMEHMPSRSFQHVLQYVQQGKPPFFWTGTGIVIIVCGVVAGVQLIPSQGFVYRDLKPANILIDSKGRNRIADCGTSKFIECATRLSGNYQGTFQYQAPELYAEDPYTLTIDIFSFALVLYEILVGRPVFSAKLSESHVMVKVCSDVRADLPGSMSDDVKSLITRCWSENRDKRPSFNNILAELKRIRFMILLGVNSVAVDSFLHEILHQAGQLRNAARNKISHQT
jgi:serine/threonine protein kinase